MREIRGNSKARTIPIVVLTGQDFKDYLKHSALAEEAASFLMKAVSPGAAQAGHWRARTTRQKRSARAL